MVQQVRRAQTTSAMGVSVSSAARAKQSYSNLVYVWPCETHTGFTTGCTAFSVQEYCDRRLIPLPRIPCAEFPSNNKPEPCRFLPAIPCSDSAREYARIFSQFLRKYSTSVGTSGILNEYLSTAHTLGGTSGSLTQYLHHGPCSNFDGKP